MDTQKIKEFISGEKTLLIAPAGYGKTYTLAECVKNTPEGERQLILTHTHAGIASIREKMNHFSIPSNKYNIETIMGFAQKYVLSYYTGNDIPQIEEDNYYNFILEKAIDLFQLESVKRTVKYSYKGLFVDEYQDCTKLQHQMLMVLSDILPIHIMGDPMQGIFDFKDPIVDFEEDLKDFKRIDALDVPWRWKKEGNNEELGNDLRNIREILLSDNKEIKLSGFDNIEFVKVKEKDIYNKESNLRQKLNNLIKDKDINSLLVIFPEYINEKGYRKGGIRDRTKIKEQIDYSNQLILLEAIDAKDFYAVAKNIDDLIINIHRKRKKIKNINENILKKLFKKGRLKKWIDEDKLRNRRGENREIKNALEEKILQFIKSPNIRNLLGIILFIKEYMKIKPQRYYLLDSIIKSMNMAIVENINVYESMIILKNRIRKIGRKIQGKVIGTTLLTKGLEFDVVVILNAHRFTNYKHFYVAITRASKKLIVFSEKEILKF